MDAIETIILTTIVNVIITGLVGGIVIYTLQRKIDATIQKSLFEYQTKFARLHAKRMESMEAWHQKFTDLSNELRDWIAELAHSIREGSTSGFVAREKSVTAKIDEFDKFHDATAMFMPLEITGNMGKVAFKTILVGMALRKISKLDLTKPLSSDMVDRYKEIFEIRNEEDYTDPDAFVHQLLQVVWEQITALGNLYKSVAEIDYEAQY